jgi:hypothetical protein
VSRETVKTNQDELNHAIAARLARTTCLTIQSIHLPHYLELRSRLPDPIPTSENVSTVLLSVADNCRNGQLIRISANGMVTMELSVLRVLRYHLNSTLRHLGCSVICGQVVSRMLLCLFGGWLRKSLDYYTSRKDGQRIDISK